MTKIELLRKYEDMATHNLFCYSKNYLMSQPKDGYEIQWREAMEECKLLREMILKEEANSEGVKRDIYLIQAVKIHA